jgi:hypothetical protein
MTYKKLIMENLDKTKVVELNVFDFDGTTMDTLYPEIAKPIYKEKTGNDWPFKGWWGRRESLDMDIFDFKPLPAVKADYDKVASKAGAMNVSLTGRRPKLKNEVKAILDANGYKFHRYMYNYGSDTLSNKIEQIGNLLEEFPNIKHISMWDDRVEHVPHFKEFLEGLAKEGKIESYNFTQVPNPQWSK